MEIVVKGRRTEITDRFRQHAVDKLSKLEKLDGKVIRLDVMLSHERNPRLADQCEVIELTLLSRGPVIRAEAGADDPYAALDVAYTKLEAQLRKAAERRRVHHGSRTPVSVSAATATAAGAAGSPGEETAEGARTVLGIEVDGDGPLVVREKVHEAAPMGLDQALYEMELVGHDFFLFIDAQSKRPSVVYRRRGYDYGVIRLAV